MRIRKNNNIKNYKIADDLNIKLEEGLSMCINISQLNYLLIYLYFTVAFILRNYFYFYESQFVTNNLSSRIHSHVLFIFHSDLS